MYLELVQCLDHSDLHEVHYHVPVHYDAETISTSILSGQTHTIHITQYISSIYCTYTFSDCLQSIGVLQYTTCFVLQYIVYTPIHY